MLRLHCPEILGAGYHRSGWPYAIQALAPLLCPNASVVLDDVVERTFFTAGAPRVAHHAPWVGVFHLPPKIPKWYLGQPQLELERLLDDPLFLASIPMARLFVSLGPNSTKWLVDNVPSVPVVELRHPTELEVPPWQPSRFALDPNPKLVQIGWFLRDTSAIYRVETPAWLGRVHLVHETRHAAHAHWICAKRARHLGLEAIRADEVLRRSRLDDTSYDALLTESVAFVDLVSSVASNTVVECIARSTPIVVNRQPGPVAYLGADYPLFYDDPHEVPALLTRERILEAHRYLALRDKRALGGTAFANALRAACTEHVPELAEPA